MTDVFWNHGTVLKALGTSVNDKGKLFVTLIFRRLKRKINNFQVCVEVCVVASRARV
jgi:hypothetical protein